MSTLSDAGPGANIPVPSTIFLSYRSVDDEPPPEKPEGGYVRYLRRQLRWKLGQLGVTEAVLWMDRYQIDPSDDWTVEIADGLNKSDLFIAVLSRNYIASKWCDKELRAMSDRVIHSDGSTKDGMIFRVDKQLVPECQIFEAIRNIQAVRLYEIDRESNQEEEFYSWGRVVQEQKYFDAIDKLATAIYKKLNYIGVPTRLEPPVSVAKPPNGRVVFLAIPAWDMRDEHRKLARELTLAGYQVVPDPDKELPLQGDEAQAAIVESLKKAEFSIHLLGEKTGFRPDGCDTDIAPFQFRSAADEASRRSSFYRVVWAPEALPCPAERKGAPPRQPLEVRDRFGAALASDNVVGDTLQRFTQFVLQRLDRSPASSQGIPPVAQKTKDARTVYVHYAGADGAFALEVAKSLKAIGLSPVVLDPPEDRAPDEIVLKQIAAARCAVLCWRDSAKPAVLAELNDSILSRWRDAEPDGRSILVVVGPPKDDAKARAIELTLDPSVDRVIDLTSSSTIDPALFDPRS